MARALSVLGDLAIRLSVFPDERSQAIQDLAHTIGRRLAPGTTGARRAILWRTGGTVIDCRLRSLFTPDAETKDMQGKPSANTVRQRHSAPGSVCSTIRGIGCGVPDESSRAVFSIKSGLLSLMSSQLCMSVGAP
jgi:hypothetical protein